MDRNEVRRLRIKADELKLIGREFLHMPMKFVMDNCNGIGPEWFPKRLRKFIDRFNPAFKVTAAIHDLMFACGYDFARANDILYINGKWEAKAKYAWYNPLRYLAMFKAWRFAMICQKYGYYAWKQAQRRCRR